MSDKQNDNVNENGTINPEALAAEVIGIWVDESKGLTGGEQIAMLQSKVAGGFRIVANHYEKKINPNTVIGGKPEKL